MRTARDFEETHTSSDGLAIRARFIRPEDAVELRRAFERLSPQSRFRRFFGSIDRLDDATVRYLTEVDGEKHVAIVALTDSPDLKSEIGLGVARFIRMIDEPEVAEAAVVVVDDYQGRGIGTFLAELLSVAARERGVKRIRAEVLASNEPMRQLMREVNANVLRVDDASIVFEIPLVDAEGATPGTRLEAAIRRLLAVAARQMAAFIRRM
jgi:GNAT superfamily N-acetyltransferase